MCQNLSNCALKIGVVYSLSIILDSDDDDKLIQDLMF